MSILHNLPFDVWSEIASFTAIGDLSRLSGTSSTLLSIIRPFFYRVVVFSRRSQWTQTLDLLARDKTLACAVVQLEFTDSFYPNHLEVAFGGLFYSINLAAITNLTSLRCFKFSGNIFTGDAERREFWRILASKTPTPLEQLMYKPPSYAPLQPCHADQCDLVGLKVIQWHPRVKGMSSMSCFALESNSDLRYFLAENLDPLWSVLPGSLQTLTTLGLPSFAFNDDQYHHLKYMRFPNLLSLTVDPVALALPPRVVDTLTEFLLSHDTVEELCLASSFDVSRFSANAFPRLRSFKGTSSTFEAMVLARMACLSTTLCQVGVLLTPFSIDQLHRMFAPLRSSEVHVVTDQGCQSGLKKIEIMNKRMPCHFLEEIVGNYARWFGSTLDVFAARI
jgi:hypothetical protein